MNAERQKELEEALERAAHKMMSMALSIENVDPEFETPAIRIRAEAALAFAVLHPEKD